MPKPSKAHRRAFTMLELIAVVVMLGLISTIGLLSISGPLDRAELIRASQAIANADRKEREFSRQNPLPAGLTIQQSAGQISYFGSQHQVAIGNRLKITDVVVQSLIGAADSVTFSSAGQSSTYAIRLESHRGAAIWVLIIGMTGQVIFDDSTADIRSLLALAGGP